MVILTRGTMDDEHVVVTSLPNDEHEFIIEGVDGDEEIWLLYEPIQNLSGHFQVTLSFDNEEEEQIVAEEVEEDLVIGVDGKSQTLLISLICGAVAFLCIVCILIQCKRQAAEEDDDENKIASEKKLARKDFDLEATAMGLK